MVLAGRVRTTSNKKLELVKTLCRLTRLAELWISEVEAIRLTKEGACLFWDVLLGLKWGKSSPDGKNLLRST